MPGTSRSNGARSVPSSSRSGGRPSRGHRVASSGRAGQPVRSSLAAHLQLRLPAELESVTAAHHSIFGIEAALDPEMLDDLRLLISELVTNAIRHAGLTTGDWIELVVDVDTERVRVEVRDPGPGFDPAQLPARTGPSHRADPQSLEHVRELPRGGWGLEFLRRIASRWGVERNGLTSVWFELDLERPSSGTDGVHRWDPW
jgi:anti-sigma regulatory factor (Ser/Thr protein kinase)